MSNNFKLRYQDRHNFNTVHGRYNSLLSEAPPMVQVDNWALETGEVVIVNADYTCRVLLDSGSDLPFVSYMSPWFAFGGGHGMYVRPEANSRVLVGRAFNGEWYIMGFIPLDNMEEQFSPMNGRKDLQEGDMCLSTAYGNYIEIRKNAGCIILHNNDACKIILDSKENQIFMHSQRLYIVNAAGSVEMTVNKDGDTITTGYFRMKLDDEKNFVKIMMGNIGLVNESKYALDSKGEKSSPKLIFSINICNKASITVDTEGNVITYCNSEERRVEEESTLIANGVITDMSAKDILHRKMQTANLVGVVDPESAEFDSYSPSSGVPAPPSGDLSPAPTKGVPAVADSAPSELGNAPPPTQGGQIVCMTQSTSTNGMKNTGVMTIYGLNNEVLGSYKFVNGTTGNNGSAGSIPYGVYTVGKLDTTSNPAMTVIDHTGSSAWKFPISDVYDPRAGRMRVYLRIHPEGGLPGTDGCFGIVGSVATLEDCKEKVKQVVDANGGTCKLEYIGPMRDIPTNKGEGSAVDLVKHFEGCKLTAYLCPAGVWTIGYGHTGSVDGVKVGPGMTITQEKAEELLNKELESFGATVDNMVSVPLTPNQRAALTSFAYNVGPNAFRESTLRRKLNSGDYEGAKEQFMVWTKHKDKNGNKVDSAGLIRRRRAEATYFDTGELKFYG